MNILEKLKQNLRIPLIAAPMYIVSNPAMVIAQCKAGIVGSFPALNARPKDRLKEWIIEIRDALETFEQENPDHYVAPFAVNQICHQTNDRLRHDMDICVEHQVPIIITSLRPPHDVIEAVHGYGGVVIHDVISIRHAVKALEQGVDGLIAVVTGAGGHAGAINPFALVSEIREIFDGPLVLSGAISTGSGILAARALGADFAYMGTRFIASTEAAAPDDYKQMIIDGSAKDITLTSAFSGISANYLDSSIVACGFDLNELDNIDLSKLDLASEDAFSDDNATPKAWRDIWSAGQGLGSIHEVQGIAGIVIQLANEYEEAKKKL